MSILAGLRVVEFEGLGPGPFCAMLLADLGADVIVVERAGAELSPAAATGPAAICRRGKRAIALDLKNPKGRDAALKILAGADALIEGFRPGVMERLGLGPDAARRANRRLVYGRMTGWGQTGPLAGAAGHDINYVSLAGAAWHAGAAGAAPVPPPTLVGDVGGGALYLAIGVLAGILRARETGEGTIVDAAIVDGSAHMMNLLASVRAMEGLDDARGKSMLDGASFYDVFECSDGLWISLGPLEPKFYAALLDKLGLADDPEFAVQYDRANWPRAKQRLRALIARRPREHWRARLEGSDVCFAPVLAPREAARHPHIAARAIYRDIGGVLQTAAAPRFDGETPRDPGPIPALGRHTEEILREAGLSDAEIAELVRAG